MAENTLYPVTPERPSAFEVNNCEFFMKIYFLLFIFSRRFLRCSLIIFSVLICVISGNVSFSQVKDSAFADYRKDTLHPFIRHPSFKPTTDFDQRFSFIKSRTVNIWGQRAGVLVNEKFKVGIGVYFLNDKLKNKKRFDGGIPVSYAKRNLTFGTVYFEPFLLRKKYFELSVPFELGFGRSLLSVYQTATDNYLYDISRFFFPAGTGLSISLKFPAIYNFKPPRWIGINFLAGYRYCFFEDVFKTDYDGLFYSVGGAIFLDRISDDYKAWKKKRESRNTNSETK